MIGGPIEFKRLAADATVQARFFWGCYAEGGDCVCFAGSAQVNDAKMLFTPSGETRFLDEPIPCDGFPKDSNGKTCFWVNLNTSAVVYYSN